MPVFLPDSSFSLEAALGNKSGYATVNKFGQAPDCDNGVATDVWDGADGATSTDIWVPPTTARIHDIASTSANDAAAGTGARTIRVFGLTSWSTAEVSEDITLNGVTNVPTVNSYVIIHRMKCLTFGSGATNAGILTATAQTDATVTAAIQAGEAQTLMAIYGVPSTQDFAIVRLQAQLLLLAGASPKADGTLFVNERPDQSDSGFLTKERFFIDSSADSMRHDYFVPKVFPGPCLIKVQITSNTNNSQAVASFDAYLVDK